MPLSTYDELQTSILSWLARPGDPLVSPAVPDMIQLFEREATRRLKVGGAEKCVSLTALSAAVALPADFGELRLATSGGVILTYVTPMQLPDGGGSPAHYTIVGNEMRLGPAPSGGCTIEIVYQSGVPPLSESNVSNWLLAAHPDCYLFGSLVEAESFIGSDERVPLWAQRREAAFASIETADRKARWGGAPLSIRAEGVSGGNGTAAGDWTSAPPVPIPIARIVAGDGLTGGGSEGIVTVALDTPVAISRGGTGANTAAAALANLGGAPLDSAALIGNPTAPTAAPGDNDTSIATTGFVGAALSAQVLAGDVTGPTGTTAVVRLQGRPVAATAPTSLQVLQWSGTNWVPATIAAGGTLTGVTAGTGIAVTGVAPSPTVSLTVPVSVANGGTGLVSGVSGGVLYFSATAGLASSTALAANTLMIGGGAGAAPATSPDWTIASNILTGNLNATGFVNPFVNDVLRLQGANAGDCVVHLSAIGGVAAAIGQAASGTAASPTALAGQTILSVSGRGYDGTAWSNDQVGMAFAPLTNPWTTGDHSTQIAFSATPAGSATSRNVAFLAATGCNILGATTNSSALAGYVGEVVASNIPFASPVALTSVTTRNLTSISLTAGDWDVDGNFYTTTGSGTVLTDFYAGITLTNNGLPSDNSYLFRWQGSITNPTIGYPVPMQRMSLAATTTIYLAVTAQFSTSTLGVAGNLRARRAR